ncbi:MAG: ABC transporter permease [Chloroflexota bacterium]|nr:ABC transporter permease [Chloroflexota bacterium]
MKESAMGVNIEKIRPASQIGELIRYKDLIRSLVIRDLKVRYKSSVLGFIWSLLNPLLMMVVFTFVFTIILPSGKEDFPIFFLAGLLPWQFFANSVAMTTRSIVDNAHLIKKVYFPREVLPLAGVLSNLVNFLLALAVFFALSPFFRMRVTVWIFLLPLILLIQLLFTLGLAFVLCTANVFYRDTQHIMDTLMLLWFFLTPIFYSLEDMQPALSGLSLDLRNLIYTLNPMASLIKAYRAVLYYGRAPSLKRLGMTLLISLLVFVAGSLVFDRYDSLFSEEV